MICGDLFAGIGGFSLAAHWMGWETKFWVENNTFCKQVLRHHFPKAKEHDDIRETDFTIYKRQIDILTGGFPCQKFSIAGDQTGDISLIDEELRALGEIEPDWFVAENVGNILNKKFQSHLDYFSAGMVSKGYEEPLIFDCTADAVSLSTMERHIWFVTQANRKRSQRSLKEKVQDEQIFPRELSRNYQGEFDRWKLPADRVCELGEGVSRRLDAATISEKKWHTESLRGFGNAINPQVAFGIFKIIQLCSTNN